MQNTHKLDLLIALYIFCIAIAELMGPKTFPLLTIGSLKLNASIGIFVIPVLFTINDIVSEVYGKARARNIVHSGLFVIFLIFIFSLIATHLPPSPRFLDRESAFDSLFQKSARIALSSLVAFTIAEILDIFLFNKLRQMYGTSRLWLRNNVSNILSQGVDTIIFMTLAFYAIGKPFNENMLFLLSLIIPYWALKCAFSFIETPFAYMGVNWLRRI